MLTRVEITDERGIERVVLVDERGVRVYESGDEAIDAPKSIRFGELTKRLPRRLPLPRPQVDW